MAVCKTLIGLEMAFALLTRGAEGDRAISWGDFHKSWDLKPYEATADIYALRPITRPQARLTIIGLSDAIRHLSRHGCLNTIIEPLDQRESPRNYKFRQQLEGRDNAESGALWRQDAFLLKNETPRTTEVSETTPIGPRSTPKNASTN